mgnify:CR=1 FL=1
MSTPPPDPPPPAWLLDLGDAPPPPFQRLELLLPAATYAALAARAVLEGRDLEELAAELLARALVEQGR